MTVSAKRKLLLTLVNDLPEEKLESAISFVRWSIYEDNYDDDEPPLTDDEIRGLAIAKQELAEGKGIPLAEVIKELW